MTVFSFARYYQSISYSCCHEVSWIYFRRASQLLIRKTNSIKLQSTKIINKTKVLISIFFSFRLSCFKKVTPHLDPPLYNQEKNYQPKSKTFKTSLGSQSFFDLAMYLYRQCFYWIITFWYLHNWINISHKKFKNVLESERKLFLSLDIMFHVLFKQKWLTKLVV